MLGFWKEERGGILPFVVVVTGAVILMGALAVNMVRVEHRRSTTQSVLDICVLNAAAQRQALAPRTVLDDCLAKHDFEGVITTFSAQTGRIKSVTATATSDVGSMFLSTPETYSQTVSSTATEGRTNLEIVLALDVSNSMGAVINFVSAFDAMKSAANTFVETMLSGDDGGRVSIAVVPYTTHVNLGADLAAQFTLTGVPAVYPFGPDIAEMRCVDPPAGSFTRTALSSAQPMKAVPFVDIDGSTNQGTLSNPAPYVSPTNATTAVARVQSAPCVMWRDLAFAKSNIVRLPDFTTTATDPVPRTVAERTDALKAKINGLRGTGETSIHLGMRWATALLDPETRPVFRRLADAGRMPAAMGDRPLDFQDQSAIKVIVLMSDGVNSSEFRLKEQYETGPSPYYLGNDGNYSWFNANRPGENKFWVPHTGTWQATAWQNATNSGPAARQLDYQELWRRLKVSYVAWQFHARSVSLENTAAGRTARSTANIAALAEFRTPIEATWKDQRLAEVCTAARAQGIYVYTIAFDTGLPVSALLPSCATTPAQHYTSTPEQIASAFAAIALHITTLQLTQ